LEKDRRLIALEQIEPRLVQTEGARIFIECLQAKMPHVLDKVVSEMLQARPPGFEVRDIHLDSVKPGIGIDVRGLVRLVHVDGYNHFRRFALKLRAQLFIFFTFIQNHGNTVFFICGKR
jgi:hypothetical protein